jgi:hypothetical protein
MEDIEMAETTETATITKKPRVWRIEILGDLDGNFEFVGRLQKIRSQDGVEISQEDLGSESVGYDAAMLNPDLAPHMTKIKNGCRGLIRELRKV